MPDAAQIKKSFERNAKALSLRHAEQVEAPAYVLARGGPEIFERGTVLVQPGAGKALALLFFPTLGQRPNQFTQQLRFTA